MRNAADAGRADRINSGSDLWGRQSSIACRRVWKFRATRARGTRAARREACLSRRTVEIIGSRYSTVSRWRRLERWRLRQPIRIQFGRERARAGRFVIAMWLAMEFTSPPMRDELGRTWD